MRYGPIDPIVEFSGYLRDPILLIKNSGAIADIINRKAVLPASLNGIIDKSPNVFALFDLGRHKTIESALQGKKGYFIRNNPGPGAEVSKGFYLKMPVYLLKVMTFKKGLYLGVMQPVDVLPLLPFAKSLMMFFSDVKKDSLIGFNQHFANLFGHGQAVFPGLVDRPLSDFMDPTPREMQERYCDKVDSLGRPDAIRRVDGEAFCKRLAALGHSGLPSVSLGTPLENRSSDSRSFIFGDYFNGSQNDFELRLETESLAGHGPIFLWAYDESGISHPENGYMAGPDANGTRAIIKKKGYVLTQGDTYEGSTFEEWIFEKRGLLLRLKRNGKVVVSFFDFQMSEIGRSFVSIGLRPEYAIRIRKASFRLYVTLDNSPSEENALVKLKTLRPRNALLSLFPNHTLAAKWPDYTGYILTDITPLETKAEHYRTRYAQARALGDELTQLLAGTTDTSDAFIGESAPMQALRQKVKPIAESEVSLLIEGDTGTGKEVLARYIHRRSPRSKGPFIKIDCSVFPRELLESELFGHEKGAFTGALDRKIGRFEQANGGSVFLDEISNLPMTIQAKLLGVLQDHAIHRVGGSERIPLDIRVMAATNIPMNELLATGRFREDLFYRISTVTFTLPPLRERHEDIPALTAHFLKQLGAAQRGISGLTAEAFSRLYSHAWPGNIRELKNVIHRALLFCTGDRISAEQINFDSLSAAPPVGSKASPRKRAALRKEEVARALEESKGNIRVAAKRIGASRKACYDAIRRFDLNLGSLRAGK